MKRHTASVWLLASAFFLTGQVMVANRTCDTALLVIDVKNFFLGWHPWITAAEQEIVPTLETLIEQARAAGVDIIYIRDISLDRREGVLETLAVADAIAPQEGDAFFTKELGDALTNPALREHLNSYEIRRLLISGIASDGCVQSTIYSAYRSGYEVVIVTDEHAHSDGEAVFAVQMNNLWLGRGLTGMPMSEIDWATFACLDESTESDTREEAEPSTEDQAPLGSPPGSNPIISKAGSGALSPVRCSALDHIGTCSGNLSADSRGIFTLDSVLIHASRAASWICVGFLLMLSAPIYTWSSHRQSETAVHKT